MFPILSIRRLTLLLGAMSLCSLKKLLPWVRFFGAAFYLIFSFFIATDLTIFGFR
jgi:hypothetical protein